MAFLPSGQWELLHDHQAEQTERRSATSLTLRAMCSGSWSLENRSTGITSPHAAFEKRGEELEPTVLRTRCWESAGRRTPG